MSIAEIKSGLPAEAVTKARVITVGLVDVAVDLALPTAVYLLLTPTHLAVAIRLTMGGFLLAGKAATGRADRPATRTRLGLAAAGAVAACAVTAVASAAGAGTTASIVAGTSVTAVCTGLLLRADRRPPDRFALLVLAELAISVILASVSSDPRFILARPAAYSAVAGIYMFTTLRAKPFMMGVTRPFASEGNPVRAAAFDRAWHQSARFRAAERMMTVSLAITLLAESALRVITVYRLPEHAVLQASVVSQLPALGLFALWFLIARFAIVPVASREVDALMS